MGFRREGERDIQVFQGVTVVQSKNLSEGEQKGMCVGGMAAEREMEVLL